MTRLLYLASVVLLSSLHAFAQQNQPTIACPATEQAVRGVSHQIWAAGRSRDVAAWDKLVDDSFISTDDGGVRKGKQESLPNSGNPKATSIPIAMSSPKMFE
jgi:hypothetical protein